MADLRYLEYIRKLDKIVIPKEFTYFVHNTLYGKNEKPYDKMWEELPTDSFTVNRDMSFVERDDRVKEAFDYGGVTKAANSYSVNSRGKNFQIRLLMPKRFLSKEQLDELDMTPEEQKLLRMEYSGLGDQRHPKIKRNENIYIFASSQKDEISGKNIDILYGIREQDIERYAKLVHKALKHEQTQDFKMTDETLNYTIGDDKEEALSDYYDSTKLDYTLDNEGLGRYTKQVLIDSNGNPSLTIPSKFEQEFLKEQGMELPSWDLRNWNMNPQNLPKPEDTNIPGFEEKFNEKYGDIIEPHDIMQIKDNDLLRKLRMQNGIDPNQNRIEFFAVDGVDKEGYDDYDGMSFYMRDRKTGKIKQIKLPLEESQNKEDDIVIDVSRSAKGPDGKLNASTAEKKGGWVLFDGTVITAFKRKDGEMCLGTNDDKNRKLVNEVNTKNVMEQNIDMEL